MSMASPASQGRPPSFWDRRERVVFTAAGLALAAYITYRAYQSPAESPTTSAGASTASQKPGFFSRLHAVVSNYAQAIASASDACATVAGDLQAFLKSDTNELPRSLKQLAKLVQSTEVQASLRTSVETVALGASQAFSQASGPSCLETILESMFSERGRSLVSLAVGVASKNATSSFCEFLERMQTSQPHSTQSSLEAVVKVLSSEDGNKLLSLLIAKSIKSGMSAYVEATSGYNMYDDMLSSITKPEHRDAVSDIMTRVTAAFCREVAVVYRKASMQPMNLRPAIHEAGAVAWEETSRVSSMDEATGSCLVSHAAESVPRHAFSQQSHAKVRSSCSLPSKQNAPKVQPPAWVKQVADLAKEKDVRALVVDVASSATREATRGVVETLISACSVNSASRRLVSTVSVPLHALLSILLMLMMFAMSPPSIVTI